MLIEEKKVVWTMIRLIAFDLDNTLAGLGEGICPENLERLKKIESKGVMIAVCSGKPVDYLCGFMRQAGLKDAVLVGENGAVIQFGVGLPPDRFYILPYSEAAKESLAFIKNNISGLFPHIWFQPNLTGVTPFPENAEEFEGISGFLGKHKQEFTDVEVYRHIDSFDIVPKGIDKKKGLEYLVELTGILPKETVAVGDGVNDYPMFEFAGYSVEINLKDITKADSNFGTVTEALDHLLSLLQQ